MSAPDPVPSPILIAGPTASGKSALALTLAERLGGVVINANSMQVYRDLRIITARPSSDEVARAPHALYGHIDAAENYSVGRWCADAKAALADAARAGRCAIVTGGTGLYFKALTQGLAAVPPVPDDIRRDVRGRIETEGTAAAYAELASRDPIMAGRLMPNDRTRISRALEVILATGRSLSDWHRDGMPPVLDASRATKIFLSVDRVELYGRIDARFEAMLSCGAVEEVRALAERRLDPSLPAMKAHGVPWLVRWFAGEITLAEAAEGGKRDTRRYTKRQGTWFRHQLPDWLWLTPDDAITQVLCRKSGR